MYRQKPMLGFIVDFYIPKGKLIIEIDGGIHKFKKANDLFRDNIFITHDFKVLRFSNYEVFHNTIKIINNIKLMLQ